MPTLFEAISKRYISCRQINYIIHFFILTISFLNVLIHMNREVCAYNIDFDIECN